MRYLILSDIHGNWEALRAVLRQVRRQRFDAVLMLGDVVGYGAAPNQVVEALRCWNRRMVSIRGNHDKVVSGVDGGEKFNHVALVAALWSRRRLTPGNLHWVRNLPQGPREVEPGLVMCHGSPLDEDTYVFSEADAWPIFAGQGARVTFFGHTHVASYFAEGPDGRLRSVSRPRAGVLELDPDTRYLLNPGSIGQPRDRDPRASYMTYDSGRGLARWHRVAYPVAEAQSRIREAELPEVLANRLAVGS
ncbi:MAG TPA: metallophosphoesterase family protein [Thermoanaerobaculia bacterium]|nr:metallophosphoesterase family protein [Thermoanaerobaculia bacterium]